MQWPRWLWLWVLFPALSVGAFEAIRHRFFDGLPAWAGNTVAAVVAAVGSAVYYWLTLHLVWRLWRDLQERMARAAALEERARIAGDLHDSVSQALFFLNVELGRIERWLEAGDVASALPGLREARKAVQDTYRDVRETIAGLRAAPDDEPLVPALREALTELQHQAGLEVTLEAPADLHLPVLRPEARREVLGIVREALRNARKHAQASSVRLALAFDGTALTVRVEDDGRGFDPAGVREGFGLVDMRRRAARLGGTLSVTSAPTGTAVILRIPAEPNRWE